MSRADLTKQPQAVARMFDQVADRYDRTNDVLSLGQTYRWRNALVQAINPMPAERILDLAAGTGTSADALDENESIVVPCDFSLGMLKVGQQQAPYLPFVAGDAMALPFADAAFDVVTISFGLRNIVDVSTALAEMYRVTKPGGRMVVCEFSTPVNDTFRTIYLEYLMKFLPEIATRVSSNPEAYVYLAESIREWPDQPALARLIQQSGWKRVAWRNLSGGIVALHRGFKPQE